jgi:hypothetical protein
LVVQYAAAIPYAPRPWKSPRFKIALLVALGYTISPHSSASALLITTQIRDDPPISNAPFGIRQISVYRPVGHPTARTTSVISTILVPRWHDPVAVSVALRVAQSQYRRSLRLRNDRTNGAWNSNRVRKLATTLEELGFER